MAATETRGVGSHALQWALALGALALLIRLPLIAVSGDVSYAGDTAEHFQHADEILNGHYDSDYRVPGYPFAIALLDLLPGDRAATVVTVQHLLGVLVVMALVYFGSRWFGRVAGVLAGMLAAVTPVMLGLEHTLQPDFLFGAVVLAGTIAAVEAARHGDLDKRLLAASGIAFACAAYIKPVGLVAGLGVGLGLLLASRSWRRAGVAAALVLVTAAVLVLPWMVRNELKYGHFTLSTQGGQTLFKRVFDVDKRPVPTSTADGRLVARLQLQQRRVDPRSELNSYVSETLQRRGYSAYEAVSVERRVALRAIQDAPLAYLAATPARVVKFLTDINSFSYDDLSGGENSSSIRPESRSGPVRVAVDLWFAFARVLSSVWWILSLSVLAGLLLLLSPDPRTRTAAGMLAGVWLAVALTTALVHGGLRRYSAEMAPEAWLFGAAGAALVGAALVNAIRPSRQQERAEPEPAAPRSGSGRFPRAADKPRQVEPR